MRANILHNAAVFILIACTAGVALATPPRPVNQLRDDAGLLSPAAETEVANLLQRVKRERNIEVLLVTINQLPGQRRNFVHATRNVATIESYAKQLFNEYRIGSLPANQGVLLLIAKQDRRCRIQLGAGYASHTDTVAKRIIDEEMLPEFRRGDYERGIKNGVEQVASSIAGLKTANQVGGFGWWWLLTLPVMFLASGLVFGASLIASGKRGWGWVAVGLVYIQYLRMRNWYNQPSYGSDSDSGDNWFGDCDSFAGGDSGFDGGGYSDGGGASGSW